MTAKNKLIQFCARLGIVFVAEGDYYENWNWPWNGIDGYPSWGHPFCWKRIKLAFWCLMPKDFCE